MDWTTGLYEHHSPINNVCLRSSEMYSCRQHCLLNDESAEARLWKGVWNTKASDLPQSSFKPG